MANEPELAPGAESEWVTYLQQMLAELGVFELEPDGRFGTNTEASVTSLQQHYGIDESGQVGPQTWKLIAMSRDKPAEGATFQAVDSSVDTVDAPEFENDGTA